MFQSAASLCIGIGSFCDPPDVPGMAHFLEHSMYSKYQKGRGTQRIKWTGIVLVKLKCPVFHQYFGNYKPNCKSKNVYVISSLERNMLTNYNDKILTQTDLKTR